MPRGCGSSGVRCRPPGAGPPDRRLRARPSRPAGSGGPSRRVGPGGPSRRAVALPATAPQPQRCDIDAVITATMSHRGGYARAAFPSGRTGWPSARAPRGAPASRRARAPRRPQMARREPRQRHPASCRSGGRRPGRPGAGRLSRRRRQGRTVPPHAHSEGAAPMPRSSSRVCCKPSGSILAGRDRMPGRRSPPGRTFVMLVMRTSSHEARAALIPGGLTRSNPGSTMS